MLFTLYNNDFCLNTILENKAISNKLWNTPKEAQILPTLMTEKVKVAKKVEIK
jgi:hypothetical protein